MKKTERKEKKWTPEEMINVLEIKEVRISPDGKRILYTVTEPLITEEKSKFVDNIHLIDSDGKNPIQLTRGEYSCNNPQWSPDGKMIAFLTDRPGKQNIWLIKPDGGEAWQISDVKTEVIDFIWSPEGKNIAFTMKDPPTEDEEKRKKEKNDSKIIDKDLKNKHIWLLSIKKENYKIEKAKKLTTGDLNVTGLWGEKFGSWSPDGKYIFFTCTKTSDINDYVTATISKVDIKTGRIISLLKGEAHGFSPLSSPDGKWLAFIGRKETLKVYSDTSIAIIPSEGGSPVFLPDTFNKFMRLAGWSKDSRYIYFTETRGTGTVLSRMPLDGSPPADIINDGRIIEKVNIKNSLMAFTSQTSEEPEEVYITDLEEIKPLKITGVNKQIPSYSAGKTEIIKWKSTDGLEIEGLLTYPAGYEKGRKYPLLLVIHGGPPAAFQTEFIAAPWNYPLASFVSEGYLILRPNVRGSDGYRLDFRKANLKDLGGMDFQDLMSGVDHVITMGIADKDRLGVMGRSYGGFLTAWTITRTDRFKAASVGCGTFNYISEQGTTDLKTFSPDYWGCQYWENPDIYMKNSPAFHIKGVKTPTLIQHGEDDIRVPVSQSYELYYALKEQNVPVELIIYPRTGHGSKSEPKLLIDMMKRNIEWFGKYV